MCKFTLIIEDLDEIVQIEGLRLKQSYQLFVVNNG